MRIVASKSYLWFIVGLEEHSPSAEIQVESRFEVTLICINDAQLRRDTGSSVKLLLGASRVSRC
jgi:hypothetical protein